MSKASAILICPTVSLQQLPDRDRDVLRSFFTEHVRGMDRTHDRRWRRFIRDLFNAAPGEGFQLYRVEERGGPYHRMHRVVLTRLFDSQDHYEDEDVLHDWLKIKCYFVDWVDNRMTPRSTSFDECPEDDMRDFHKKMVELLYRDPRVTRRLWPHLPHKQRMEMVDAILRDPNEPPMQGAPA